MQYHLNDRGEAKPCKAMVRCPFGDLDSDHYVSAEAARAAYEAKMAANPNVDVQAPYVRWRRGKTLSTRDLKSLPAGATVRWPYYDRSGGWTKTYADYEKTPSGYYRCLDHEKDRLIDPSYLGGAGGNERAKLVSVQGLRTEQLTAEAPAKARKAAEPKYGILCISNVSDAVYLDYVFAREASAVKKMRELNAHDHLHHSYELVSYSEAQARMTQDRT